MNKEDKLKEVEDTFDGLSYKHYRENMSRYTSETMFKSYTNTTIDSFHEMLHEQYITYILKDLSKRYTLFFEEFSVHGGMQLLWILVKDPITVENHERGKISVLVHKWLEWGVAHGYLQKVMGEYI